jgi:membrane carboxypeptidase/penicillin-binding protein
VLYQAAIHTDQAFDSNVADTVNAALKRVVTKGTGFEANKVGRPVAGKTGTTDSNMSAWFSGYAPNLAASVMFAKEDKNGKPISLRGTGGLSTVTGGSFPARIWTAFMKAALKGVAVERFHLPKDVLPTETPAPTPSDTSTVIDTTTVVDTTTISGDAAVSLP